ncbi:FG-GAP repeat domain-containing protein [Membranihabitans maritimus]|uniref:FG-GAP repeat domain-containing protein n=1 Tax=Membranihabitans maritimus TaxID=2904244 RepID=UPI001F20D2FB|nr:VCBS repeat-containing protein [Membranihabitans maritimus]
MNWILKTAFIVICPSLLLYMVLNYPDQSNEIKASNGITKDMGHGLPWKMHLLDPDPQSGSDGVKLADVNGDGLPDLVSGFEEGGVSRIYIHPGYDKIDEFWNYVELSSPHVEDAVLIDLDQNGILDLVTASEGNTNQILFHWAPENPGDYMNSGNWKTEVVPVTDGLTAWMFVVPTDMDGKNGIDLIVGSKRKKGIHGNDQAVVGWLKSPPNPKKVQDWEYFPLTTAGWVMSIKIIDMNDDKHPDILISDRKYSNNSGVRWLENPGRNSKEFYKKWKSHMIGVSDGEPMFLTLADLDNNGAKEILVPDLYNGIIILKQQNNNDTWNHYKIPYPSWSGERGKALAVADINIDGQLDIVLSFEEEGNVASIPYEDYKINGKHSVILGTFSTSPFLPENWIFEKISAKKGRKFDLVTLLDLDGDGDLDVLTNDENEEDDGLGVVWYENPIK